MQNILQKKPGEEQKPEKTELSATIYLMPKKLSEKVILEFCVPEQKLLFQKNATPEALTQAQQESLGTFKHGKAEYGLVLLKQPNPQIPGIDSREDKQIDIAREFLTGGFKRLSIAENDRIFLTGTEGDNAYTSIRQLLQDRKELVQQILAPYKKQLEQTPIPPTGTPQTGTPLPISDDLDNLVRALKQLASVTGH
ncbi:MAG: hypothetical protein M1549_02705 [Candidatus Dependentiae bacterium]|nr:hypothetical protein [Candidatus Dependentiae bacterium]